MITLQKDLTAPAGADHLVTHLLESRGRVSPQHHHRKQTNQASLNPASKAKHGEPQLPPSATPPPPTAQPSSSDSAPAPGAYQTPQSPPRPRSSSSADSETP